MSLMLILSQALLLVISILMVIFYPQWKHLIQPESMKSQEDAIFTENIEGYLLTKEELSTHGPDSKAGIYIGLLGRIYDVTTGHKHYGKGGVYSHFSGIDGTRAFSTGEFDKAGLVEDIRRLSNTQLLDILTWHDFYTNRYPLVGRLIGLYYDEDGQVTEVAIEAEKLLSLAIEYRKKEEELREKYPPCNVHTNNEGTRFWCSQKSGGIERDWIGVPREFFNSHTRETNCVCVRHPNTSNSDMRLYENCEQNSSECFIKPQ